MLEPFREMLLALDLHRKAPPSNTQQSPIDSDLAAAIAMSLGEPAPEPATAVPPPSQKQEDPSKEKMVHFVAKLQETFAFLLVSDRCFIDPTDTLNALFCAGPKGFEIGVQEDVTELNDLFVS